MSRAAFLAAMHSSLLDGPMGFEEVNAQNGKRQQTTKVTTELPKKNDANSVKKMQFFAKINGKYAIFRKSIPIFAYKALVSI